jgi:hypothetical protein
VVGFACFGDYLFRVTGFRARGRGYGSDFAFGIASDRGASLPQGVCRCCVFFAAVLICEFEAIGRCFVLAGAFEFFLASPLGLFIRSLAPALGCVGRSKFQWKRQCVWTWLDRVSIFGFFDVAVFVGVESVTQFGIFEDFGACITC